MINIIPFKAVRPPRDKANLVASRPFYNYKKHILSAKLEGNPYTFLHVINPEFRAEDKTKPNTVERFKNVRKKYEEFITDGILRQDDVPSIYLYRQITPTNTFIGLIAGVAVQNYLDGTIKVHEHTLTQREEIFCKYIDVCRFNAEPVLLTYKDNRTIEQIIEKYLPTRSEYEFSTTDRIKHDLWLINTPSDIETLQTAFGKIDAVYIADGHHRTASSALYATSNLNNKDAQYFLSFFIAESNLKIYDFNRAISDLNGLDVSTFLQKVSHYFAVKEITDENIAPSKIHEFSMYLDGKWYRLITKPNFIDSSSPVGNLDPHILSETILANILNVKDLKKDKRAQFIDGTRGIEALKNTVDSGKAAVAFGLFPISIKQLKLIADTNNVMPPKSTWIEPKLRSGLTIYAF